MHPSIFAGHMLRYWSYPAKVFRTYLASTVVSKYLKNVGNISDKSPIEKI